MPSRARNVETQFSFVRFVTEYCVPRNGKGKAPLALAVSLKSSAAKSASPPYTMRPACQL